MSLRKSPTMTPARLDADRRNAQKLTGPRAARGKAQVRMNGLRSPISCGIGQGGTRTAPTCTRVNCRAGRRPAWAERRSPNGTEKECFFPTFKAGMLLKTNEA